MPTYVTLFKWTEQGVKDIKNLQARLDASAAMVEAAGGKVSGVYITMGPCDIVTISEGPDDETASALSLAIAARGNVTTTTMRAFTPAEFAEVLKKMP